MSEGRLTRDDLNPNVLESLRGPQGESGPPGEQGLPGNDAEVTSENIESALGYTPANKATVDGHESRLVQLESGSSTAKADVAGLNREVAYLKLKQDASERVEGGTVFADDFKGNRFGFTLDEVNSSGFKIKNGKLIMTKDEPTNYSVTDGTVVASAYSTAGNGGRKITRLDNGWFVFAVYDSANTGVRLYSYNGTTYNYLGYRGTNSGGDFAISSKGNTVYLTFIISSTIVGALAIDATTANGGEFPAPKIVDSGQNAIGNVSLAIDPTNGHLHAAWASKNATYPNSFNIRYAKSTDGGVAWSAVEQVTIDNNSSRNAYDPAIVAKNGKPSIIYAQRTSTSNTIFCSYYDGTSWKGNLVNTVGGNVFSGGAHVQSNPSAVVDKDGVIHVVWHGRDATHTSIDYIRFSKSTDGGATWSTMKKLVPGINATITVDKNNKYIINYSDNGVIKQIESTDKGENWTVPVTIANGTNPSSLYDSNFGLEITKTPVIYLSASTVKFTGNWTEQVEVPTTTATAVYNVPSTDYVGAYVQKTGNLTVTAKLNGTSMESELDSNEYQFEGSLASDAPATLRLELSRPNTTGGENDAVTRILGGRS